ncbi:hypothetical protein PO909_005384 [Leuciscus waleckii]
MLLLFLVFHDYFNVFTMLNNVVQPHVYCGTICILLQANTLYTIFRSLKQN